MLQIPKFYVPVPHGNKVAAIFCERYGLDFGAHLVTGYLYVVLPIPDVHYHIMLRTNTDDILVCGRKGLQQKKITLMCIHFSKI